MDKNLIHENFNVAEEDILGGVKKINHLRSDRKSLIDDNFFIKIDSEKFKVLDYSDFGISVASHKPLNLNEQHFVPLLHNEYCIGEYNIRLVRKQTVNDQEYKIAFEITDGCRLPEEKILAAQKAEPMAKQMKEKLGDLDLVPSEFMEKVYKTKILIEQLKKNLNHMQNEMMHVSQTEKDSFNKTISCLIGKNLADIFYPFEASVAHIFSELSVEQMKACKLFFRNELDDLIFKAPFSRRSYEKPYGYAGDFDMMNIIYNNDNLGSDLFADSLHQFYINHPNAKAVRNRSAYLYNKIRDLLKERDPNLPMSILSVASGPAKEVQMIFEKCADLNFENVEFTFLDQDIDSLKYLQSQLRSICGRKKLDVKLNFLNKAIKNVVVHGIGKNEYNLIYSAGLFDYFPDQTAKIAAKRLYNAVKEGGKLIIGNFTQKRNNDILMQLALDWELIYRTHQELVDLYSHLHGNIQIEEEAEGINLFAILNKY